MLLRGGPSNWARGVFGALACWLVSPDAAACTCSLGATLEWPGADQTDVPLDTSIVVSGYGSFTTTGLQLVLPPRDEEPKPSSPAADAGAPALAPLPPIDEPEGMAGLYLVSASGKRVTLAARRLRPTVDCTGAYHYLRPMTGHLEPNTKYELYEGATFVSSFTTSNEVRDLDAEKAAARAVVFETLGTTDYPPRITTAYVAEIPSTLTFVHYVGSSQEVTYRMVERLGSETVTTYDFGALECPEVELLGMDGEVLDRRALCEPDRCKAFPEAVGGSSCGGNFTVGVTYAEFATLPTCPTPGSVVPPANSQPTTSPSGTSEEPNVDSDDPDGSSDAADPTDSNGKPEPGPAKVPVTTSSDGGGCAVVSPERAGRTTWGWLLAAVGVVALARRLRG